MHNEIDWYTFYSPNVENVETIKLIEISRMKIFLKQNKRPPCRLLSCLCSTLSRIQQSCGMLGLMQVLHEVISKNFQHEFYNLYVISIHVFLYLGIVCAFYM